jgi:DNA mismatch endonuclease (patch repair protein)
MDKLSVERRSENMRQIRSKNTKPEVLLRSMLHKHKFRFRIHDKKLPGHPDLAFASRRKVIFVHGCFWHLHDDPNCIEGRIPSSRVEYWKPKLLGNHKRDTLHVSKLKELGLDVLTVWECEFKNPEKVLAKAIEFLKKGSK